jgi:hypothetical protein
MCVRGSLVCVVASFVVNTVSAMQLGHVQTASQMMQTGSTINQTTGHKYTQWLTNFNDVLYTSPVSVGGHNLKAIVDTGSFDQVVLTTHCKRCGNSHHLYHYKSTGKAGALVLGILSYGSGTVYTTEVVDSFSVGQLSNKKQPFWAVTDAEMPLLEENAFQVIFGIGPPASVLKFAHEEQREIHRELDGFMTDGGSVDAEITEIVARYDGNVVHAKATKPFVSAMGIKSVSACFFKPSGSGGFIIWDDDAAKKVPTAFQETPVVGNDFWSAKMSGVKFGRVHGGSSESPFGSPTQLGCGGDGCDAILDTGSSLIAAPGIVVSEVYDIIDRWVTSGGTCDDLSMLPDLEFSLGNVRLSLPAESYIGRAYGDLTSSTKNHMPNFERSKHAVSIDGSRCEVLLVEMDDNSWVLGMPFFRKYYTTFTYNGDSGGTMSFSVANDECKPHASPASADLLKNFPLSSPRPATLRVDASKIRLPGVVGRRLSDVAMSKMQH